jgi:hypothetical protein
MTKHKKLSTRLVLEHHIKEIQYKIEKMAYIAKSGDVPRSH